MLVEYYGHSCFAFTDSAGRRVIVDPYDPTVGYKIPNRGADVTLVSHAHFDHDYVPAVTGRTTVLRGGGRREAAGLTVEGFLAHHDASEGAERGHVTVFRFEMDGLQVVHLSDLGGPLPADVKTALGRPDLLLVPVGGGGWTLDGAEAARLVKDLKPRRAIPMHYRTPFLKRDRIPDLETAEPFLKAFGAKPMRECTATIDGPGGEQPEILALSHMF